MSDDPQVEAPNDEQLFSCAEAGEEQLHRLFAEGLSRQGLNGGHRLYGLRRSPWEECPKGNPTEDLSGEARAHRRADAAVARSLELAPGGSPQAAGPTEPRPWAWRPVDAPRGALWRNLRTLRRALRPISQDRVRACGWCAPQGVLAVMGPTGHARWTGTLTCGSVWECPVCAAKIAARRSREVAYAAESHGLERCVMVTLTLSHSYGDDLEGLRRGIARAWRAMCRGAPWKRAMKRLGITGQIRALEVTHGPNGWHPHLHVLLLLAEAPPPAELLTVWREEDGCEKRERVWLPPELSWLIERWQTMVERHIGPHAKPNREHAVRLSPARAASYLQKLGLEMQNPGSKKGRRSGHRTPFEIGWDYYRHHRRRDVALWHEYVSEMRGAKQLTWTRGLKQRFGLHEATDFELAEDDEPTPRDVTIAELRHHTWEIIRSQAVEVDGQLLPAPAWLLYRLEQDGPERFKRLVLELAAGEKGCTWAAVGEGAGGRDGAYVEILSREETQARQRFRAEQEPP